MKRQFYIPPPAKNSPPLIFKDQRAGKHGPTDRFHALTGIKFTSLPVFVERVPCRGGGGGGWLSSTSALPPKRRRPRARLLHRRNIKRVCAARSAVYENREAGGGGGGSRAKWPLSVRTVNGSGLPRNRANKFPSRGGLSRIIGYFVPRRPYGICYGKDLRILFRLPRAFHFPAAFPPHLDLGGGGPRSSRVGWV